jgi:hypothetical protein
MSALTITDDLYISDVHKMFLVKIACCESPDTFPYLYITTDCDELEVSCMTFSIYEGLITLEDESLWVWT